jgi:hypothetical protein
MWLRRAVLYKTLILCGTPLHYYPCQYHVHELTRNEFGLIIGYETRNCASRITTERRTKCSCSLRVVTSRSLIVIFKTAVHFSHNCSLPHPPASGSSNPHEPNSSGYISTSVYHHSAHSLPDLVDLVTAASPIFLMSDGHSACMSWYQATIWDTQPDFFSLP